LGNAFIHADKVLAQYERDAGRVVRRRYRFPTKTSISESVVATGQVAQLLFDNATLRDGTSGKLTRIRETEYRQWFSGAFTYYLPIGYESRNALARVAAEASTLLGLSLTPDVLWELTPWSWAVDWFSNAGDVIHNISRFADHGLVMRYGYMMEHSICKDTYILERSGLAGNVPVAPLTLVTETKQRRPANPFGFGLTWEGLSSFQAAILAALGITRLG
jgi:hypothetical protein